MSVVPFPQKVMVQTISRCNASCVFCPYPALADTLSHGTMEEDLFRRIIDECAEHPGEVERLMPYLMNEPLMDGSIVERINYAKQRNPSACVHILTNGSLLTERRGDALLDSDLDWIGLSVHGFSEEAYGRGMGLSREVTYRRVERFVKQAIARRGPGFVMVTFNGGGTVTAAEREAELAFFRDLGVQRISYFGRSISRAGNVPSIEAPRHGRVEGCRSIWWPEMLHVLYNGDVVLCCMDWGRQVVVGNLQRQSIAGLWRSESYQRVRDQIAGRAPPSGPLPCLHCEEAIVEPVFAPKVVDVALVVLPCAVLDSDASTVPGVQYALRAAGLEETLVDLSAEVYGRVDDSHSYLWRRAGHGVVHHGDASRDLIEALPDELEWCVTQAREIPARHLLFPFLRTTAAFTLEVVRRVRERDPQRSLLVFGSEKEAPALLRQLDVPYHPYLGREAAAAWVAMQAGRAAVSSSRRSEPQGEEDRRATPESAPPRVVEAPWRPPGWEGTGAGMVPPAPDEQAPPRWLQGLGSVAGILGEVWRHPLSSGRELGRHARSAAESLLRAVGQLRSSAAGAEPAAPASGVPGSLELPSLPTTRVIRSRAEPAQAPTTAETGPEEGTAEPAPEEPASSAAQAARPPPAATGDGAGAAAAIRRPQAYIRPSGDGSGDDEPWQRRPDRGRTGSAHALLATLPPWGFSNPPVGLAHLATYARSKGYGVELLDLNVDLYRRLGREWELLWHVENKNYWSNETTFDLLMDLLGPHLDHYADLICAHPAPLLGLSVVDPKERCTIELVRRVKQRAPDKRILLGGPACVTPEYRRIFTDTIPDLVDGYALGEGEQILCDVIEAVAAGVGFLGEIPGVLCHQDGVDVAPKRRRRLIPLDQVPFPGYEDFDLGRYIGDELIVEWSRGCIGSCTFCKGKMIDGRYRSHSAGTIFASLERYANELQIRKFTVCDPVINGDAAVLEQLCQLITAAGLEVQWRGEAIPHPGLTAPLLRAMRQAGCTELQLGVESGSDRVLQLMHKRRLFSAADAARVVQDCHDAGIRTALFVIVGFPGEGEQEFIETYSFVRDNAAYIDELKSVNSLHIITDTAIHAHPERHGLRLPERDYHYRWSTVDGSNTLEVRNQRIRRLLELAAELDIFVRETNLAEGKHQGLEQALGRKERSRPELLAELQKQVEALQSV